MSDQIPLPPSRHHIRRITRRTLVKSWDDSIFSESAQAAFWSALSMPPLLLGMLGSLSYVAPMFEAASLPVIEQRLIEDRQQLLPRQRRQRNHRADDPRHRAAGARGEVVSLGFVISLWAGSSAISAFVDSIVEAHDGRRCGTRSPAVLCAGPVRGGADLAIVSAPFMALGPRKIAEEIPDSWHNVLHYGYYPVLLFSLVIA